MAHGNSVSWIAGSSQQPSPKGAGALAHPHTELQLLPLNKLTPWIHADPV